MQLPGGLGKLQAGRLRTTPLSTPGGTVILDAVGVSWTASRGAIRWLHPQAVTVIRPYGRNQRAPVTDRNNRVLTRLGIAGIALAWYCRRVSR